MEVEKLVTSLFHIFHFGQGIHVPLAGIARVRVEEGVRRQGIASGMMHKANSFAAVQGYTCTGVSTDVGSIARRHNTIHDGPDPRSARAEDAGVARILLAAQPQLARIELRSSDVRAGLLRQDRGLWQTAICRMVPMSGFKHNYLAAPCGAR